MSLRDFLPVSQALSRVGGDDSRFRPADPGLLPDFSARRGGTDGSGPGGTVSPGRSTLSAPSGRQAWPTEGVAGGARAGGALAPEPAGKASGRRLPAWLEQLVLVFLRPGNRRRRTRPVQPELNFDSVRVVRNDLATSDVEVVLVRPSGRPASMSPECRQRVLRVWWEEGTRRLRRLGHTLW